MVDELFRTDLAADSSVQLLVFALFPRLHLP